MVNEKKKENSEVVVFKKEWGSPGEEKRSGISTDRGSAKNRIIITSSEPRPKKRRQKTLITTRDLPTWLENYHGKKEEKNG